MKKIMFSDKYSLTRAVLEGRKTMTRRIIPEDVAKKLIIPGEQEFFPDVPCMGLDNHSRYKVGEVVAVAQAYRDIPQFNPETYEDVMLDQGTICEESHPYSHLMRSGGWDNKMFVKAEFMPNRIRITNVRVERLKDISEEDCIREGILEDCPGVQYSFPTEIGYCGQYPFSTPREAFAALIDKVSGKGTWESNPYCFCYEFELIK